MAKAQGLTIGKITKACHDQKSTWISDATAERGGGRLLVRVHESGSAHFYFRYFLDGKATSLPMGAFTAIAQEGLLTLEEARVTARHYSALHRAEATRDVRAFVRPAKAAAAASLPIDISLVRLCNLYVEQLERDDKTDTARTYRSNIKCHIASSAFATKVAADLSTDDATEILRCVVDKGAKRTPGQVRSLMMAAYGMAIRARTDCTLSRGFLQFQIKVNPIAGTESMSRMCQPGNRHLSELELGHLWIELTEGEESDRSDVRLVRVCLLLAWQRIAQLTRCKHPHLVIERGEQEQTICQFDKKGNRIYPREHVIPLTTRAALEIEWWVRVSKALQCEYVFPGTEADNHINTTTSTKAVARICQVLMRRGLVNEKFRPRDLRRTAETHLAKLGVIQEVRGQLQSHGLGGVQNRHYNRYDYFAEKLKALFLWEQHLDGCKQLAIQARAASS